MVKNLPTWENLDLIPGSEDSLEEREDQSPVHFQYSCHGEFHGQGNWRELQSEEHKELDMTMND